MNGSESTAASAFPAMTGGAWQALARGFLCLFWGVGAGVLLFFEAFRAPFLEQLGVPAYLLGVVTAVAGLWAFRGAPGLGRGWRKGRFGAWASLFLLAYLAPFVAWWRDIPYQSYFVAHLFLFTVAALYLLYVLNGLCIILAEAAGDAAFAAEARLCGLAMPAAGLMAAGFFLYTLASAIRHDSGLYAECFRVLFYLPPWVHILALLPFSLTMACLWKARHLCLRMALGEPGG